MKIAFFANDRVDYFFREESLFKALERTAYDVIVIYPKKETVCWEEVAKTVNQAGKDRVVTLVNSEETGWDETKYTSFFNGHPRVCDVKDILFLESYKRKSSIVVRNNRLRIKARLDEEEKKLPEDQFVRISRHNIINMRHIKVVEGEALEMDNGEVLYISNGRKKKFHKRYGAFLKNNHMKLQ